MLRLLAALTSPLFLFAESQIVLAPVSSVSVRVGTTIEVPFGGRVKAGFHIHANPPSDKKYIPTEISLKTPEGISLGPISYPKGKPYSFQNKFVFSVYSGEFEFFIPLTVAASVTPGLKKIEGSIRYQACDENICYLPATDVFSVPLLVTSPSEPKKDEPPKSG